MDSTTAAFVKHVRALLDGAAPNGQCPETYGDWADVVRALHEGHASDGTAGVCQALNALLQRCPELGQLLSGDNDQEATDSSSALAQDDSPSQKSPRSAADRLIIYALDAAGELFVDQFGQAHVLVNEQVLPFLLLIGLQGAAKSSTQRLIKRVLDPRRPESIRLDPREVIQKAAHCQVALFDNVSGLQGWAIDILCRLVTGEGDSKRRLYTDDDDIIYELKRVVLVNGINPPADRPDFTDRCLPIELERLDDDKRIPEEKLWAFVQQEHGKWFGALTA
jgi:hypothetical protein